MPSPASRRCTLWIRPCFNIYIKEVIYDSFFPKGGHYLCPWGQNCWQDYMIAVQWVQKWGENYYRCCCPIRGHKLCLSLSKREKIISVAVCGGTNCVQPIASCKGRIIISCCLLGAQIVCTFIHKKENYCQSLSNWDMNTITGKEKTVLSFDQRGPTRSSVSGKQEVIHGE